MPGSCKARRFRCSDRQIGRKVKAGYLEELPVVSVFGAKSECAKGRWTVQRLGL